MSLPLESHSQGILLHVHAQPAAKKNAILKIHDGRLKVAVTQAPEKGKANQAIIEVLAKSLGLKRSQISLLNGELNSHKQFLLTGCELEQIHEKLTSLLPG